MEDTQNPSVLMESTGKIIRSSVYYFLNLHFEYFTQIPEILLIPFSASVFLSQALFQYYSHSIFRSKLESHLYQTIFGYVFCLPLSLSSLIAAKSCVVHAMTHHHHRPHVSPYLMSLYRSLLMTYLCNLILIITINFTAFLVLFFISKNSLFRLIPGVLLYVFFAHYTLICNLSLAVTGIESCKGYKAIHKVFCSLKRGRRSMAVLLALPFNLGLVAVESLFRFQIVRAYQNNFRQIGLSMVLESFLICYMHSILTVLDTIACCLFIKSWESNSAEEQAGAAADVTDVEVEIVN